ncbi:winged helix-turn-helix domain-containing protein [Micromonospora sp. NPDC049101]|uniref:AfsR/SARP family transcriptional regulator n=1 Tax=Micromonospora sp. NPDC049101 TaxID=3155032 RepID=UPI0034083269
MLANAWQSRKARDLLRILAARRGRAVPREQLGEMLWPAQDPDRVSHRLSVALSTLRGVLDPERRTSTDHFIIAAHPSLALDVEHVELDVEEFLAEAAHGLRLAEVADRHLGRALELEPHDEGVHGEFVRTLTAAGRHGEAAQAYRRYVQAMSAIGVPAQARGDLVPPGRPYVLPSVDTQRVVTPSP